uniref:Ectonucleotide pyrophosphatase/phosphodiesterase family member 5 n=1 Tax=Romanomermis culicivorax TaxID=13658 RepID=A0A915KXX4_ROMCU
MAHMTCGAFGSLVKAHMKRAQLATPPKKYPALGAYLLWRFHTAGLLNKMNIIFTADHGMASVPILNVVNMDDYLNRSMYTVYGGTPNWNVQPAEGKEEEVYETLKHRVPHLNVYNKTDIPVDFHYKNNKRIMDLQLVADLHWWITYNFSSLTLKAANDSENREGSIRGMKRFQNSSSKNYTTGEHGYNNSLPVMHPYFIGYGPAFKKSFNITQFVNIDLYVLMCYILNIKPSPNNGSFERVRSILSDEGLKWPKTFESSAKFQTFFDQMLRKSGLNGSKSGFVVEYEFHSINFKTNVHYDVLIMFVLLFAYLIYMAVLVRSIEPPIPNAKEQYGHKKLIEEDVSAFYAKTI